MTSGPQTTCVRFNPAYSRQSRYVCWGYLGSTNYFKDFTSNIDKSTSLFIGTDTMCGLYTLRDTTNNVECFGNCQNGMCELPLQKMDPMRHNVSVVSVGLSHVCAIQDKENGLCWGGSLFGQADIPVVYEGGIVQIAAGNVNSCVIKINLHLGCWGKGYLRVVNNDSRIQMSQDSNVKMVVDKNVDNGKEYEIQDDEDEVQEKEMNDQNLQNDIWNSELSKNQNNFILNNIDQNNIINENTEKSSPAMIKKQKTSHPHNPSQPTSSQQSPQPSSTPHSGYYLPSYLSNQISALHAGGRHTCATMNGILVCTGNHDYNQLTIPPELSLDSDAVSLGWDFSCGLGRRHLRCWGFNYHGQLEWVTDRDVGGQKHDQVFKEASVSAGLAHTCMLYKLREEGGEESGGVVGNGNGLSKSSMSGGGGRSGVMEGLSSSGSSSDKAHDGYPSTSKPFSARSHQPTTPISSALLPNAIRSSAHKTIARFFRFDGIACWGGPDHFGQTQVPARYTDMFASIHTGLSMKSVHAGDEHTCLNLSGSVECWGSNAAGQTDVPQALEGEQVKLFGAGADHNCAYVMQHLLCWGSDSHGQSSVPGRLNGENVRFFDWGEGDNGWGGDIGDEANININYEYGEGEGAGIGGVLVQLDQNIVVDLAAGVLHNCVVIKDNSKMHNVGQVVCWGLSQVSGREWAGRNIKSIESGWGHTCAIDEKGVGECQGDNEDGQCDIPVVGRYDE